MCKKTPLGARTGQKPSRQYAKLTWSETWGGRWGEMSKTAVHFREGSAGADVVAKEGLMLGTSVISPVCVLLDSDIDWDRLIKGDLDTNVMMDLRTCTWTIQPMTLL